MYVVCLISSVCRSVLTAGMQWSEGWVGNLESRPIALGLYALKVSFVLADCGWDTKRVSSVLQSADTDPKKK